MSNYFEEARTEACTFLGRELTDAEWTEALPAAQQKLVSIISRYGDSQGDRLAPYYLGKLAALAVEGETGAFDALEVFKAQVLDFHVLSSLCLTGGAAV